MSILQNINAEKIQGSLTGVTSVSATTISATTFYGDGSGITNVAGNYLPLTGGTVTGDVNITEGLSGKTALFSSSGSSGSTIFKVQGSLGNLFEVKDTYTGSLFSVNNISAIPVFEVFNSNIILGNPSAPSTYTTSSLLSDSSGVKDVYTLTTSGCTGIFFDYVVNDATNARSGSILAVFSGNSVQYTEASSFDIGNTSAVTFSVTVSAQTATFKVNVPSSNWTIKTMVRHL